MDEDDITRGYLRQTLFINGLKATPIGGEVNKHLDHCSTVTEQNFQIDDTGEIVTFEILTETGWDF